jgi:hypothetical protein
MKHDRDENEIENGFQFGKSLGLLLLLVKGQNRVRGRFFSGSTEGQSRSSKRGGDARQHLFGDQFSYISADTVSPASQ